MILGESAKVALAVSLAKEHGIRLAKTLNVAGAYHSRLMNSAFVRLGDELQRTQIATPSFRVICNVDAIPSASRRRSRNRFRIRSPAPCAGRNRWNTSSITRMRPLH